MIFAFKAALAMPRDTQSLSQLNPLSHSKKKNKRRDSQQWTNREILSKIAEKKLIFATRDTDSCDQWISAITFLVISHSLYTSPKASTYSPN